MTTMPKFLFSRALLFGVTLAVTSSFATVDRSYAASARVKAAQEALTKLGFEPGAADGAWGKASREALNKFQKAYGFKLTRKLTSSMGEVLKLVVAGAQRAEPLRDRVVGNTIIGDAGWRVYFSPDGVKTLKLKDGKKFEKHWRKKADGTYCEYSFFEKRELCGGDLGSGLIILKTKDKWFYFEKSGKKKFGHIMVDGDKL